MFKEIIYKIKQAELTLPTILGHGIKKQKDSAEKLQQNENFKILDKITSFFFGKSDDLHLFKITKKPLLIGVIVILLFFGFFIGWSILAPIEGAVVAGGQVTSSSNRKIIQHLEGGVIEEILVKEGDKVEAGNLLIKLKNISSKSQKTILEERLYRSRITESRLISERDNYEEIYVPIADHIEMVDVIDNQRRLFVSRKKNLDSQISVLNARTNQSNSEKESIRAQLSSEQEQVKLVEEELENKKKLLASGNIERPHVIALEKQLTALHARIFGDHAAIAKVDQQISSTNLEILNLQNNFQNSVVNELKEIQSDISDVEEKLLAIGDIFDRTEIKAIQSGTVTNLQYHTVGGVILPGAKIMEIIPIDDDLMIEAKVLPKDIDAVLYAEKNNIITIDGITGSAAKIKVLALNSRKVGMLQGVMTNLSADTITDPKNPGMQYYLAQIKIPGSQLQSISHTKVKLYPGMQVAVFIITEPRTLISYLFSPISSTFDTAFRER